MYEPHSHKVLPLHQFAWRFTGHLAPMPWVDAFLNSSMLLGGMGPVGELTNDRAKIFAGCYALYAGLIFIVSLSIVMAPVVHRLLHVMHAEEGETRRKKS